MTISSAIQLCVTLLLLIVVIQDFKYRAVSWVLFPLLFSGFFLLSYLNGELQEWWYQFRINISFLLVQWLLLSSYFSWKRKKLTNIMDVFIGWGDLLLLIVFAAAFHTPFFLVFIVSGFLLTLIAYGIRLAISKNKGELIPLAGCLGIFFLALCTLGLFIPELDVYNNNALLQTLTPFVL